MSCQLSPLSCCACACDPSVIVNLYGSGSGSVAGHYGGDYDPNEAGLIPDNPDAWNFFSQEIPGDGAILTTWTWNPNFMTWK